MENKLTQEYKDDLYEKVLEKKRVRTIRRKKMLSVFIVFVSIVGITTFGFSRLEKEDYKNFFRSKTENIMIDDEYVYYDDLGIKIEFINIDENKLTIGVNIKYDNIAEYDVNLEEIRIEDENNNLIIYDGYYPYIKTYNYEEKISNTKANELSVMVYILEYKLKEKVNLKNINIEINNVYLEKNGIKTIKDIKFEKKISIE